MSARVLIIEDNSENLELMSYLLQAFGHTTVHATSGAAGLELARGGRFDLIVCDIQLPDMDGFAVMGALRSDPAWQRAPVVAVTALAMSGDRERILRAGFDAYVPKPIDAESFVPQLEAFLDPALRSPGLPLLPVPETDGMPHRATVLVVDDHLVNLNLKRSLLEPLGYAVLLAHGMTEALGIARRLPPDLIISDVGMCDGSGFDFIQIVRNDPLLQAIPFIFITSTHCDEAARQQGLALGASRFLFRPIAPETVLAEIESCLAEHHSRRS